MRTAFDVDFTPSSGGAYDEATRYNFEVIDGVFRKDVIANRSKTNGLDDSYYHMATNARGETTRHGLKEKADLTPEQVAFIENSPAPTWGAGGDEKSRWSDFYNIIVKELGSGKEFGKVDKLAGWVIGGLEFELPGGVAMKSMYAFIRALTGTDVAGTTKFGQLIAPGTKFSAKMKKNAYTGYYDIRLDTILADGVKPVEPVNPVVTPTELSEPAKMVLDALQSHKDAWNGMSGGVVLQKVGEVLGGVIPSNEVLAGWQAVKARVLDGNSVLKI